MELVTYAHKTYSKLTGGRFCMREHLMQPEDQTKRTLQEEIHTFI